MGSLFTLNLDLIITGITVAGMIILGFTVFVSNSHSVTTKAFLIFTVTGAVWSVLNYMFYHTTDPNIAFLIIRAVICVTVLISFSLFHFLYVFPNTEFIYPKWYRFSVILFVIPISITTLTPFVFERINTFAPSGTISGIQNGPGIFLFVATIFMLNFGGLLLFIHKMYRASIETRSVYKPVLWGLFITSVFIITFNLILPVFFNNSQFILYSSVFVFPTVIGAVYAIRVRHLFNIKVFSTALLVFLLSIMSFAEIITSHTIALILFRTSLFAFMLLFGINLIRSVIHEVEQREKIQKLADELQIINDRQETLIHFIGHEVKGFLTKAGGALASLSEGDFGALPGTAQPFAERALAETRQSVESVSNILKAANLKKGTVTYTKAPFDLKALVTEAVEKATEVAQKKGLTLSFVADDSSYQMMGDKEQINSHVLRNLIDNAINYTPSGSITISLKKVQDQVLGKDKIIFAVTDSGVGITNEDKERLFTEGGHGKNSQTINVHSTGYGLFIAKQIVEAHGGTIRADSEGAGKGSTFVVEFPMQLEQY